MEPRRAQIPQIARRRRSRIVQATRVAHLGRLAIVHVVPDDHAARPEACMGGWGNRFLAVSPSNRSGAAA